MHSHIDVKCDEVHLAGRGLPRSPGRDVRDTAAKGNGSSSCPQFQGIEYRKTGRHQRSKAQRKQIKSKQQNKTKTQKKTRGKEHFSFAIVNKELGWHTRLDFKVFGQIFPYPKLYFYKVNKFHVFHDTELVA